MNKVFALSGMVSGIVFVLALALFGSLTPDYSQFTNAVSELGMESSRYSPAFNFLGFVFVGVLVILFAVGFYAKLRPAPGSIIVPLLVGISGIGFAGLGFFPAENGFQPSAKTSLHFLMVSINFLPFLVVAFVYALRMNKDSYWRRWSLLSVIFGVASIGSFFIPGELLPVGISQRVGLGAYFLWILVMSWALYKCTGYQTLVYYPHPE
jgi:hypothetical membrane protein